MIEMALRITCGAVMLAPCVAIAAAAGWLAAVMGGPPIVQGFAAGAAFILAPTWMLAAFHWLDRRAS